MSRRCLTPDFSTNAFDDLKVFDPIKTRYLKNFEIIFRKSGMDRDGMGRKSITHPITSRRDPIPIPPITRDGMGRDGVIPR